MFYYYSINTCRGVYIFQISHSQCSSSNVTMTLLSRGRVYIPPPWVWASGQTKKPPKLHHKTQQQQKSKAGTWVPSVFLGCSLTEPDHHAVQKLKQPEKNWAPRTCWHFRATWQSHPESRPSGSRLCCPSQHHMGRDDLSLFSPVQTAGLNNINNLCHSKPLSVGMACFQQ